MDKESLEIYLEEAYELIEKMESGIRALESNINDPSGIQNIFLSLHTLKGNTGFAGLSAEFKLFSAFTDYFRPIHGKKLSPTAETIVMLKKFVPIIKQSIEEIKSGKSMQETKSEEIMNSLGLPS